MKTKYFFFLLFIHCLASCTSQSGDKPNILLILVDDMGWSDIGCYGGEVKTPNLDRLAENGIRFTQMHNTSKCFPSRAILQTGIYAHQNGYHRSYKQPLKNCITIGEVLQTAGYRTLWAGKHHGMEIPVDRGYHRYYGLKEGACNHFNPGKQRNGEPIPAQKRPDRPFYIDHQKFQPYSPANDFYTTDYFTKYALEWLEEYRDEDKPFFLFMAYTAPHDPLMAWPEDIEKYKGKYLSGYDDIRTKRYARQKEMGLIDERFLLSERTYTPWESLSDSMKQVEDLKMAVYSAMIDRVDQKIGELLDKIASLGALENTLVMFVSDNGCSAEVVRIPGDGKIGTVGAWTSLGPDWANVSNTPFRFYKNYSFEGGICTPMIACWPKGIKAKNTISHFCGHFIDFMPTIVDITGARYPSEFNGRKIIPMQGVSLWPVMKGEIVDRDKPLFWQWARGRAVREGKWKIVAHGKNASWELYNMDEDPSETNNLADIHPEIVSDMDKLYTSWMNENEQWN
ncbi:MAG: arylsulfatase [Cytophagales bacterium]|nr:arylsulfatase [Cytophagales bacterium]